jgi:nucleoid-associated protein YgaU
MGMLHGDFEVIEPPAAPARPEIVTNAPTQPEIAANPPAEPAKGIAPPNAVAPSAPAGASSYTIVSRDTLRGVAIKLLRDARRWRDIAAVNPGLDARRLRPGQVIKLPEAPNEGSPGR